MVVSPLQGFSLFGNSPTQGVALGWHIDAPLGLETQKRKFKRHERGRTLQNDLNSRACEAFALAHASSELETTCLNGNIDLSCFFNTRFFRSFTKLDNPKTQKLSKELACHCLPGVATVAPRISCDIAADFRWPRPVICPQPRPSHKRFINGLLSARNPKKCRSQSGPDRSGIHCSIAVDAFRDPVDVEIG